MINDIDSSKLMPAIMAVPQPASGSPIEGSFENLLANRSGRDDVATVKEESRKLVAEAFITPVLAKIRATNHAAPPFGPTVAEERFGPMFDQIVADAMTRPDRFPMVEAVQRSMLARMGIRQGGAE